MISRAAARCAKRRPVAAVSLAVAVMVAASGCGAGNLQFKNDHRLSFVAPVSRAKVTAPVTISWRMKDFTPAGLDGSTDHDRGVFAVFVDRAPMPPGKDIKWLARDDTSCQRDPRCPDKQFLASKGVFITTEHQVTVDVLPAAPDGVGDEEHYVTVVLLDGTGHRIGESAWYREFTSQRRSV